MTLATDKVDAVIVGSGAGGSAMAAKLAAGGKQVVILEAGPDRNNQKLVSSALWARRLKWSGDPVIEAGENPVGHVFNAGYGVGGSAMHQYAVWPRLHQEDFQLRSLYDRALDWPMAYDDLQAFYDQVQRETGIAGDAEQEIWRPPGEPYPMPPVPRFKQGEIVSRGFEHQGMHTAPLPLAITTRNYHDRAMCIWDGWCDAGCPIGALANPLTIHLPVAMSFGASLLPDATVSRVLTTENGEFATGVEYFNGNGEKSRLMADLVVLAAFTIQNPRLLLNSATAKHPSGLGNSSGKLGTGVMTHPAAMIYGLFDERTDCHLGATGGQLVNQDGYDKLTHADTGAFGSYQWMIAQAVKPNALLGIGMSRPDLFGDDLHTFMTNAAHHFATMTAVIEDLPLAENRITLDERRDRFGISLARVSHTTHPESKTLWQEVSKQGQVIFKAAGANEVWAGPQGPMHIMGGTHMGHEPANSVCNEYGQTHDISNLVLAGAGLFPTSGGVNPTFTILALAARSGEYLLNHWNSVIQ